MDIADWTVAGWGALAFALMAAVTSSPGHRARSARRLGRAVGLEVPDALRPAIEARAARRNRIAAAGAILGLFGWLGLRLAGAGSARDFEDVLLLIGSCFVGGALGSAFAAATDRPPVPDDAVRIARTRAVSVGDYLPPSELLGARGAVAVSVVTTAVILGLAWGGVLEPTTTLPVAPLAMVLLGVVSLVLFEVMAPRILDRGRPAGSALELAWDDALRATALREMINAPLCLGLWGTLVLLFGVGEIDRGLAGDVLSIVAMGATLLVCVVGLAVSLGRPRQHYLRRLWPRMAADDVVRTG